MNLLFGYLFKRNSLSEFDDISKSAVHKRCRQTYQKMNMYLLDPITESDCDTSIWGR